MTSVHNDMLYHLCYERVMDAVSLHNIRYERCVVAQYRLGSSHEHYAHDVMDDFISVLFHNFGYERRYEHRYER